MQIDSPKSRDTSFTTREGNRWLVSTTKKQEKPWQDNQNPERPFRVFITDRDPMSSDLLARALTQDKQFHASAIQSFDLMQTLATSHADLVVIGSDLGQKARNGFDLAQAVTRAHPKILLVVLLNHSTHDSVVNAFRCGAHGVFSRESPMAEFLQCVDHVRKGFIWAGGIDAQFLLEAFRSIPSANLSSINALSILSAREQEVVRSAAKGRTNKAIAMELGLSEHTVKNYLFRAFEKLGVSNRVELLFNLAMREHPLHHPAEVDQDERTDADLMTG